MNEQPDKPKRRRFLRFGLRTMLLLMIVGCVLLGRQANKARQHREAVEWVREMGGTVVYDYETDANGDWIPNAKPPAPDWLCLSNLVGSDFFSSIVQGVNFVGAQVSDVTPLAKLTSLEWLYLNDTRVSDLTPLAKLTKLEYLDLTNARVADVTPLANLTNLTVLRLDDTQVSDVTPLAKLTNLESLWLLNTPVTEESIQQLQQALPNLEIIHDRRGVQKHRRS